MLDCMTRQWDAYLAHFQSLDPKKQADFLARQGYPRLAELLAHFAAWWQVGMEVIRHHQSDPAYQHPAMDVDAFNSAVIQRVKQLSDEEARAEFEVVRVKFIDFVNGLSDADLDNPKINRQLQIEIINHLAEHQ